MAGTLTITTPSADDAAGYDTATRTITWTFVGTAGATQTQRQIVLKATGSTTVISDTTMQASTVTTGTVSGIASGTYYDVTVSVLDSAGATTTATRRIVSTYVRPLAPVVTAAQSGPNVAIGISNPTSGGRPTVTSNTIYRRATGSTGAWTLVGTVGNGATFTDRTTRSATSYDYFVRAAPGTTDSNIVTIVSPTILGSYLVDPLDVTTEQTFALTDGGAEDLGEVEAVLQFVGRTYPVLESGVGETQQLALTITLPYDGAGGERTLVEWWRARKRSGSTLMYRDGRGRAFPCAILGSVKPTPVKQGWTIQVGLLRVDYPAQSTLPASEYTAATDVGGWNYGGFNSNGWNT